MSATPIEALSPGCASRAPASRPIRVLNLTKQFAGGVAVLDNISLSVEPGEFVVIFGPSGVGKSTFLRCLNGLIPATRGEVWIGDQEIGALSRSQLRQLRSGIGMIFQGFNLVNRASVLTNVLAGKLGRMGFGRSLFRVFTRADVAEAVSALQRAGLTDEELYSRRADTLSGGQRQRVAIARALMQRPRILLADEPVASLDPSLQQSIMELIEDLARKEGLTVVTSMHHMELTRRFATRAIGFCAGRVVYDGEPGGISPQVVTQVYGGRQSLGQGES